MKICSAFLAVLVGAAMPGQAQWGPVQALTNNDSEDQRHRLFMVRDQPVVLWGASGTSLSHANLTQTGEWTSPTALSTAGSYPAMRGADLVLLSSQVTYSPAYSVQVSERRWTGQGFAATSVLYTRQFTNPSSIPSLATDSVRGAADGSLWGVNSGLLVWRNEGGLVEGPTPSAAFRPVMLMPQVTSGAWAVGSIHETYINARGNGTINQADYSLVARRWDGTAWGDFQVIVSGVNAWEWDFDAVLDADGSPMVVFASREPGPGLSDCSCECGTSLWFTRWTGSAFSPPLRVTQQTGCDRSAPALSFGLSSLHLTWVEETRPLPARVFYSRGTVAGAFSAPEAVSENAIWGTGFPDIEAFSDGSSMVVWQEFDGNDIELKARKRGPEAPVAPLEGLMTY